MKNFGLLGEKLGHSWSKPIHAHLGDYSYDLVEVPKNELDSFLKTTSLNGFNVTIPYKTDVIPYCKSLSQTAKEIGSVNTVTVNENGELIGDNTDYFGFLYMIKRSKIQIENRKVLVFGNGGASKTVVAVLKSLKAKQIVVISLEDNNLEFLKKHFDSDVIVNTTPVGMYPNTEESAVDLHNFKRCSGVLDLIYNPIQTKLIFEAKKLNIKSENGLSMLVAQAKKASEIFTNSIIEDEKIEEIIHHIKNNLVNITLIGMPGCGKSTVGKVLAKKLDRSFIDIDSQIQKETGMHPSEIIKTQSVQKFREIETLVLSKFSKLSGQVIATGGGCVTIPENEILLKQNSLVFYLKRDINKLATVNRPISQSTDLNQLFEQRKPLYESHCDFIIDCNGTLEEACEEIIKLL